LLEETGRSALPRAEWRTAVERLLPATLALVRLGPVVVLGLAILLMSLLSPVFLTEGNFTNLGLQTSIIAVLGLGMLLVVLTRGIDLSMGSVVALSAVSGALVAGDAPGSTLAVVSVMLLVGASVGLLNGAILVVGRVPHAFIVTLATLGVARGIALLISDGATQSGFPAPVLSLANQQVGFVPYSAILVSAIAVATAVMTRRTVWGRWMYAVGGDPEAARRAGIPVGRVLISVYVMCGMTASIAGLLIAGQTNSGTPTGGQLLELDAITAVIIGGASFFGGRGTVGNVVVGALTLAVIRNGLNLLNVSPFYQLVTIGVLILVAVELDVLRGYLETRLRVTHSLRDDDVAPAGHQS
jgi:ribose transport system permease protein